ncbi:MAG TPA: hypothetical protein VK402_03430 [Blastococcus sp.]|nr:hypothetical protein [Blastococcus sp.]
MSTRRLVLTATAMAAIAAVLTALTPGIPVMAGALASAQRTADVQGPDAVVVAAAGLLAWAVWAWGTLGLALTAASALPGLAGGLARVAVHVVLPAGARRSAALALGLGVGVAGPVLGTTAALLPIPAAASVPAAEVPDWPATASDGAGPAPVPDWPGVPPGTAEHVVAPGDCLWHIAADDLRSRRAGEATDREIASATDAWWTANTDVIGPDPDLLLPGQVLRTPATP